MTLLLSFWFEDMMCDEIIEIASLSHYRVEKLSETVFIISIFRSDFYAGVG